MNNAMLAAVLPASGAPNPARAASAKAKGDTADGEFAGCMEQALDAAAPAPEGAQGDPEAAQTAAPGDATTATAAAETAPAAVAPDLATLLPGWLAQSPSTAPADPGAATGSAPDDEGSAVAALATGSVATAAASPLARTAAARAEAPATAPAVAAAAAAPARADADATSLPTATAVTQHQADARTTAPETVPASALPLPAAAPTAQAAAPRAADAAPGSIAHLAAAVDTPAFAPALATQVRWWAQDGVQQAQLTLSPPEMGPVAVKIVVFDGREARIDFSADIAATRSALEAALPVLAAALDDSGLKLSGGGVHDGSAQRQMLWQTAGTVARAGRAAAAQEGTAPIAATAARAAGPGRGLVDLVA